MRKKHEISSPAAVPMRTIRYNACEPEEVLLNALDALKTRVSVAVLGEPGPTREQLDELLQAAIRAPDHGLLRPWRFVIISGDQRHRLAELFCQARQQAEPDVSAEELDKLAGKPFRAPMILVAVAEVDPDNRVPVLEQVVATGAAVQNIMVAAHALGIGAMWRTGGMARHPLVKAGLGFADKDEIVGFVYLGSPRGSIKRLPDESFSQYLRTVPGDHA